MHANFPCVHKNRHAPKPQNIGCYHPSILTGSLEASIIVDIDVGIDSTKTGISDPDNKVSLGRARGIKAVVGV